MRHSEKNLRQNGPGKGGNSPANGKNLVLTAAQWFGPFFKFATLLQQEGRKTPENTPNYGKSKGPKLPEKGKEKSLKALRL